MPCVCGEKVDRLDPHKVLCKICRQFQHASCYDISPQDLDLVKTNFKCTACRNGRRLSTPSGQSVMAGRGRPELMLDSDKGSHHNDKIALAGEVEVDPGTGEVAPNTACGTPVCSPCLPLVAGTSDVKEVSLLDVLNELIALKAELVIVREMNSSLNETVTLLKNDIKGLVNDKDAVLKKLTDFECSVLNSQCVCKNKLSGDSVASNNAVSLKNGTIDNTDISPTYATIVNNETKKIAAGSVKVSSYNNAVKSLVHVVTTKSKKTTSADNSDLAPQMSLLPKKLNVNTLNTLPNNNNCSELEVIENGNASNSKWTNVAKKKKKFVNGSNESDELGVIPKYKWIHLSSFKNTVTPDDIINYIVKQTKINSKNLICQSLTKKDANISDLKFINFKLGVCSCYYDQMFDPLIWPANVKVRTFDFLAKEKDAKVAQVDQNIIV